MNRSERRRQERSTTKSQATYTLTQEQIDKIKRDATEVATKRAFTIMLGFPMMVMRDKHRYGKNRMERFVNDVLDVYDSYAKDYVSLEDLHDVITKETGVDLRERLKGETK